MNKSALFSNPQRAYAINKDDSDSDASSSDIDSDSDADVDTPVMPPKREIQPPTPQRQQVSQRIGGLDAQEALGKLE